MSSETTIIAMQYRLKEWAEQIKDCQNIWDIFMRLDCQTPE